MYWQLRKWPLVPAEENPESLVLRAKIILTATGQARMPAEPWGKATWTVLDLPARQGEYHSTWLRQNFPEIEP